MDKIFCLECSPTHQLNHRREKFSSWVAEKMEGWTERLIPAALDRRLERLIVWGMLGGLRLIGALKEAPITPESHVHQRTKVVAQEAARRGMKITVLQLGQMATNFFVLRAGDKQMLFEGLPGIDPIKISTRVDDKFYAKSMMADLGAPVPEGKRFAQAPAALAFARAIGFPLVVKPQLGSLSAHTSVDIRSEEELRRAIKVAQAISASFMVERYIPGHLYRATAVGPKIVAVGRRDPPFIVGDGQRTVEELVRAREEEQKGLMIALGYKPEEIPSLPRHQMKINPSAILPVGERLPVTWKINLSYGATVTDVTDEVHPENLAMFESIAREAALPTLGIDFLAPDIAVSWKDQPCGCIELNSLPSIDLHHPPIIQGTPRDVAGALLDLVLDDKIKRSDHS